MPEVAFTIDSVGERLNISNARCTHQAIFFHYSCLTQVFLKHCQVWLCYAESLDRQPRLLVGLVRKLLDVHLWRHRECKYSRFFVGWDLQVRLAVNSGSSDRNLSLVVSLCTQPTGIL